MTLREKLNEIKNILASVSDAPGTEAELMLAHVLKRERISFLELGEELPGSAEAELSSLVQRRLSREPIQYILGEWGFMGLTFFTKPCALIPRQDTETLCEEALKLIRERGCKTLLDICTGTGCIAISLAKLTGIRAEASDVSPECAALCRKNALRNRVELTVRTADLFEGAGRYDLVTANPPYISDADMKTLQPEVAKEPALALAGGTDGLDFYRRIAAEASVHMEPGGALLLEVGVDEAEAVLAMFPGRPGSIIKDLNGTDRVVVIEF